MAVTWKKIAYQDDLDSHASQHGVSGSDSVFPADPDADKYLMWDNDPGELVWAAGGSGGGNCSIKTGTYTGDGTVSQAITGVGFQPKVVMISLHFTEESASSQYFGYWKSDQMGVLTWYHISSGDPYIQNDRIILLDADGFTVDDDEVDMNPNKNNQVYDYMAWG